MGCNSGSNYDEYADVTEANHAQSVWTRRSFDTVLGPRCKRHARDEILPLGLMNGGPSDTSHPSPGNPLTNSALRKQEIIAKNVAQIAKLKMDQEKHDQQRGEWIYVAAVLDRLLLFVFILILIISACVIYTRIPDYDNAWARVDEDKREARWRSTGWFISWMIDRWKLDWMSQWFFHSPFADWGFFHTFPGIYAENSRVFFSEHGCRPQVVGVSGIRV